MSGLPTDQNAPRPSGGDDSLASLHKMSRTAGLGTTDYVAVNPTAVVSLLLGLASGLAVLGTILLVLPVVAVIVGVFALRQISRSAGTQTGRGVAILGIVIALLCVGVVGGRELLHTQQVKAERGQIISLIENLGKNLNADNYDAAYAQFGDRFKQRVTREQFQETWSRVQSHPSYGRIKGARWNGIIDIQQDRDTGVYYARGVVIIERVDEPNNPDRREVLFRKDDEGRWVIEDFQGLFPAGAGQ